MGNNEGVQLFHSNNVYIVLGIALLQSDMWQLQRDYVLDCFTVCHVGSKRIFHNYKLWHKRLGHISKERLITLTKQNLTRNLDFKSLPGCTDCYKGKLTNTRIIRSTRIKILLEVIHIDVCSPFPNKIMCGNSYFVTFIDDFLWYCYVFLVSEKSYVLDCFKIKHAWHDPITWHDTIQN